MLVLHLLSFRFSGLIHLIVFITWFREGYYYFHSTYFVQMLRMILSPSWYNWCGF